jgi:aryl-alcohol dehydrogenase-like predicted oxidoreductase
VPDVERLVFGTAALGLVYGLAREGESRELLADAKARELVEHALTSGVTTFDTAPAYGVAEERLGRFLGKRGIVWTKVGAGDSRAGIERSLSSLSRMRIDLLQWHNWSPRVGDGAEFQRLWSDLRNDVRVVALGASTYGVNDALAAIRSGLFAVVQVEWNVLNQHVVKAVAEEASRLGVRLALRSVLLQGALTREGRALPELPALRRGVDSARDAARDANVDLECFAIRAALDQPVAHVLVGFDRMDQIARAVAAARLPSLDATCVARLDVSPNDALDPRTWPSST